MDLLCASSHCSLHLCIDAWTGQHPIHPLTKGHSEAVRASQPHLHPELVEPRPTPVCLRARATTHTGKHAGKHRKKHA